MEFCGAYTRKLRAPIHVAILTSRNPYHVKTPRGPTEDPRSLIFRMWGCGMCSRTTLTMMITPRGPTENLLSCFRLSSECGALSVPTLVSGWLSIGRRCRDCCRTKFIQWLHSVRAWAAGSWNAGLGQFSGSINLGHESFPLNRWNLKMCKTYLPDWGSLVLGG